MNIAGWLGKIGKESSSSPYCSDYGLGKGQSHIKIFAVWNSSLAFHVWSCLSGAQNWTGYYLSIIMSSRWHWSNFLLIFKSPILHSIIRFVCWLMQDDKHKWMERKSLLGLGCFTSDLYSLGVVFSTASCNSLFVLAFLSFALGCFSFLTLNIMRFAFRKLL